MRVGFDIDGTIDADPANFQSLMSALRAAGHVVIVMTGCSSPQPTQQDLQDKIGYLNSLGLGHCWDQIVVFPAPPHKAKGKFCRDNNISILFDNSVPNAKHAAKYSTVLVPWNNVQGAKET